MTMTFSYPSPSLLWRIHTHTHTHTHITRPDTHMECLIFAARYHPEARTLEFDLTGAPLVDVVKDVTVTPCGAAAPLWKADATQRGLFYGRNTFILDRPLLFADDRIALVCWMRVRQQRLGTLAALASDVLRGHTDESAVHFARTPDVREYTVLLTEVPHSRGWSVRNNAFVYFTSQALPHLVGVTSTTIGAPVPLALPTTYLACTPDKSPPSSFLALAALALCYV
ncbi:unspecified product [Leishmania tarentolae]|uniref:Unspecified product n=1 Tax=Leishmania tarentolae TaxID=5689 RepID=A0A640KU45_LEITA|nr:unspecified product [Leishmania tarentolae]